MAVKKKNHRDIKAQLLQLLLGLLICASSFHEVSAEAANAASIMACFQDTNCLAEGQQTTWEHMLEDRQSCLNASRIWWSSNPTFLPVTLVTQLSVDRLPALRAQCMTWLGPLTATVYVPIQNPPGSELLAASSKTIQDAMVQIDKLFEEAESNNRCCLRIMLITEVFKKAEDMKILYPVNSLRNWARAMANTPLVANIDVDMLPSVTWSDSMKDIWNLNKYVGHSQNNRVFVIPAFEPRDSVHPEHGCGGAIYADSVSTFAKSKLPDLMDQECLEQFRKDVAPKCHHATDYERWLDAQEPYKVRYEEEYEPWFMSERKQTLWYDVRFRGYGKNKIVFVAATAAAGWEFYVHPQGFLVHRPHTESHGRKEFLKVKFGSRKDEKMLDGSLFLHVEQLWNASKEEMAAGTYKARTDDSFMKCIASLPWWKDA